MVSEHGRPFELLPIKFVVGLAPGEKETVAAVDLGEMDGQIGRALFHRTPIGTDGRLHDVDLALVKQGMGALPGLQDVVAGFETEL